MCYKTGQFYLLTTGFYIVEESRGQRGAVCLPVFVMMPVGVLTADVDEFVGVGNDVHVCTS